MLWWRTTTSRIAASTHTSSMQEARMAREFILVLPATRYVHSSRIMYALRQRERDLLSFPIAPCMQLTTIISHIWLKNENSAGLWAWRVGWRTGKLEWQLCLLMIVWFVLAFTNCSVEMFCVWSYSLCVLLLDCKYWARACFSLRTSCPFLFLFCGGRKNVASLPAYFSLKKVYL